MTDASWERVKDILHRAMQLGAAERNGFLEVECRSDDQLRREVESLLVADALVHESFLQSGTSPAGAALETDSNGLIGSLTVGQMFEQRFRLLARLGEGGMGQVWLAEQTAPVRRQVALKLIRAGMYDETTAQRFRSERQSLAMMDHPGIAKVFDAGATAHGQPYFVMEYVPGQPITTYCDAHRLNIPARLELLIRACEGVQHAHQKAIIHRDLKPANILVVEVDGVPVPRIIDFGLARHAATPAADQTQYTHFGQFVGTPGYMAPEQVDVGIRDIDTRADVYSLGVVLYVLLTGQQPFEQAQRPRLPLDEWVRTLRNEDPPYLSTKVSANKDCVVAEARSSDTKRLVRSLRGDLDRIAAKALARDREHRYASPAELAADLRRHLSHKPVTARAATTPYQLRKFVRRHRVGAVVAGIIGILAIVTSIAGLLAIRKQHEAEYQAMQARQEQSQLLTEVAGSRLRDYDVGEARRIILEVLTNPRLPRDYSSAAISVFQQIRAADTQLAVLSGHGDRVFSAAFSPDGTRIVTASADNTARIWDSLTGAELLVLAGHTDRVFAGAYSPDATRIVTASLDRTARVWDARSGAQLLNLRGHDGRVDSSAFSPDGKLIVTGSWDTTARVWDARTGAQLAVLAGHNDAVYSAAFSPDGKCIVTASQDKTARIWDARTWKQLVVLSGHGDYISSAVYSPDGKHILTASADRTARIWDARTGAQLALLSGHSDVVYGASYSPTGEHIVTASWDKTARIWDASSRTTLFILSGHRSTVATATYSPDGMRIVTASQDRTARVWNARIGTQLRVLSGHTDVVSSAVYSPDGAHVVSASFDRSARIWDASSGQQEASLVGHAGAVDRAAYSPDGARIVTASQDKTARIWDARTGIALAVLSGHLDRIYAAAFSPDGESIVTASRDKTARIWDSHGALRIVLAGHADRLYSGVYSPDGKHIVTASRDKTARVWDSDTGKQLTVLSGHGDQVLTAAYSPDGSHIVTASSDGTARVWNASSGIQIAVLSGHTGTVTSAAYSPDGTYIVTTSQDRTARLWDSRSGVQLAVLTGHTGGVTSGSFSPDGQRLVTASEDETTRIWDARPPADLPEQILWYSAAQTDPLSDVDRKQLGIPLGSNVRTSPMTGASGVGELSSLARLAARYESEAVSQLDGPDRNDLLLRAFALYSVAALRAQSAGWPDESWQHWRYRRASLARFLATQELMSQVAASYQVTVARWGSRARY